MDDQSMGTWRVQLTASEWYSNLPAAVRSELDGLLEEIMQLKESLSNR